jgi:hypothetical protein
MFEQGSLGTYEVVFFHRTHRVCHEEVGLEVKLQTFMYRSNKIHGDFNVGA